MRLTTTFLSLCILSAAPFASAATEPTTNTFEKSMQEFGKKLDKAQARGEKLGQDAKKEWQDLKAKTEKATDEVATNTKEKGQDWGKRFKSAMSELGQGMQNAWEKLKGEK